MAKTNAEKIREKILKMSVEDQLDYYLMLVKEFKIDEVRKDLFNKEANQKASLDEIRLLNIKSYCHCLLMALDTTLHRFSY